MIVSIIFLHRIYIIFQYSAYEYSKWIYRSFLIMILLPLPILLVTIQFTDDIEFIIRYDPATDLATCYPRMTGNTIIIASIVITTSQFCTSIGLLTLFIKGLYSDTDMSSIHRDQKQSIIHNAFETCDQVQEPKNNLLITSHSI